MRVNDLHGAVERVAAVLDETGIRAAVDRFRAARGADATVAAARLGHAGAMVGERFRGFDVAEQRVLKSLHLESLSSEKYWDQLMAAVSGSDEGRGEIVKLAARLMFAAQNLPGLIALLSDTEPAERLPSPSSGEARLKVSLIDAGERASNPDRIARAIDGIDMLYSACASIARRPAMDLRLDAIDGTDARDLHFTGGREAVTAVIAVMNSIPAAVRSFDEHDQIDLDALVSSLPVFSDLETLGNMGAFSADDLSNITETMRQGALLVLESGIVLRTGATRPGDADAKGKRRAASTADDKGTDVTGDHHYEAYLKEREAMRAEATPAPRNDAPEQSAVGGGAPSNVELAKARLGSTVEQDRARREEVENMLAQLKGQR